MPITDRMQNQECTPTDTAQLASQAWAAYDQNRLRECLALIKTLESADPNNADLRALQNAVRTDMQRDLDDARGLLDQAAASDDGRKYRKAAEIVLLKVLRLDPNNDDAKILLESMQSPSPIPHVAPPIVVAPTSLRQPDSFDTPDYSSQVDETADGDEMYSETPKRVIPQDREEIPFTAATGLFDGLEKNKKRRRFKVPYGIIAFVVIAAGVLLMMQSRRSGSKAPAEPASQSETSSRPNFQPRDVQPRVAPPPPAASAPPAIAPATAAQAPPVSNVPPAADAAPQAIMGKLAVSSPTATEIYIGGKYIGSTPTTLQLPVGRQTVEYRHDDLKTVITHDIKANGTTTASVTFPITVQVNAKPWAQVFLDGTPRRALGQTPLSGVTVPMGGVLIFENPNFTSKSYRITDKDTAIQVDFQ